MRGISQKRVSRDVFFCYRCRTYRRGKPVIVQGSQRLCRECKTGLAQ
jgi:hypothetical protein